MTEINGLRAKVLKADTNKNRKLGKRQRDIVADKVLTDIRSHLLSDGETDSIGVSYGLRVAGELSDCDYSVLQRIVSLARVYNDLVN